MSVQYATVVLWDADLIDLEYTDSTSAPAAMKGLVQTGVKITAGAPVATTMRFMVGAIIQNAFDGDIWQNTGTTAAPVWTLIAGGSGNQDSIQFEDEGVNLGTAGTVDELDFVGAAVTATRVGNKVTVTITADPAPAPSPYSLGLADGYQSMAGTTLTLTNPQFFTTGDIGETTLVGVPTFGTGSDLGAVGLAAAQADFVSLYNTLIALPGTSITAVAAAIETYNGGYGIGVYTPGVYTTASALGMTAAKTITLSGAGDYVFISTGGAIVFGATDNIVLTNGAVASRVFWVANNDITTGSTDNLKGNFMSGGAITLGSTNTIEGRLLAPGAITIDGTATNLYQPLA